MCQSPKKGGGYLRTSGAVRGIRGASVSLCTSKAERGVGHSVYEHNRTRWPESRVERWFFSSCLRVEPYTPSVTPPPCLQVSDTASVSLSASGAVPVPTRSRTQTDGRRAPLADGVGG